MPVNPSFLTYLKRGGLLLQTLTVSTKFNDPAGHADTRLWGVKGVKQLEKGFKRADDARNFDYTDSNKFSSKIDQEVLQGTLIFDPNSRNNNNQIATMIKSNVQRYLTHQAGRGQVCMVKKRTGAIPVRGNIWKRIEFYDPGRQVWGTIWEADD